MHRVMKEVGKHVAAIVLFLGLAMAYFSPAVFDGKVIHQSDNIKAVGQGVSQTEKYAKTAEPGEYSLWSDAMFSGMPYSATYGNPAPELPSYLIVDSWLKKPGYFHAAMVFIGLVCFYLLMCVMGVSWWLAIAGAVAFAFASYNIIIIEAGHIVKAYVIAYMPLTLAGMYLLFKRKWLWGAVLFLLGVALSLSNGHVQITYYLVLLCMFIYIGYTWMKLREKAYGEWLKASLIMAVCVVLAALPNAKGMYANWDLGQHSIRGATELTPKADASGHVEKVSSGLDKDYAFQWSYGWKELMTVIVPNVYGGSSGGTLDDTSELYKELRKNGAKVGKEVQTYTYWGDKPFTSGPVYFGALVCFLFVLGMFVIKNPMKWWLFAGSVFLAFLALGRNFDMFNDLMFHHLPLYNKFRTVEMALVIPGMVFPLIGIWGLRDVLTNKVDEARLKKGFFWALGLTGGLCLILWLMPTLLLDFHSNYDAQFQDKLPEWYYTALLSDRASLASKDAIRSLLFILLGAALLVWFWKSGRKPVMATLVGAGMAILVLADLWMVDRRYLNDSNYVNEQPAANYKERTADTEILKDTDLSFRVLGLNNPWQDTDVSYYHHSIGGYHAVKLRRYQELIDHRLDAECQNIISTLKTAKTAEELLSALASSSSLNMLNTRYIIYNPDSKPLRNPYAMGNAWCVENLKMVENADAEMEALGTLNPSTTAVVDKRFEDCLKGFTPQKDSTASVMLRKYRPGCLTYHTKAATDQLVVFSEVYYYPGWKAYVDDVETPHFRTDWILRGMVVPSGEHTVVFRFQPDAYILAANVSAYSSFLILLLLIVAVGYSAWECFEKRDSHL